MSEWTNEQKQEWNRYSNELDSRSKKQVTSDTMNEHGNNFLGIFLVFGLVMSCLLTQGGTKPVSGNCDTYKPLLSKYDWNQTTALAVMTAESSCNEAALKADDHHNGCDGSYGLFQIACVHTKNVQELYDAEKNIKTAYQVYTTQGWEAWGVCTDGRAGTCNN